MISTLIFVFAYASPMAWSDLVKPKTAAVIKSYQGTYGSTAFYGRPCALDCPFLDRHRAHQVSVEVGDESIELRFLAEKDAQPFLVERYSKDSFAHYEQVGFGIDHEGFEAQFRDEVKQKSEEKLESGLTLQTLEQTIYDIRLVKWKTTIKDMHGVELKVGVLVFHRLLSDGEVMSESVYEIEPWVETQYMLGAAPESPSF